MLRASTIARVVAVGGALALARLAAADVDVTVVNRGAAAQSNAPVTFGHVFKQGDVPNGAVLGARLASGAAVPLQVDAKVRYADGSLRHGVLTAVVPSLPAGGASVLTLATGGSPPPGAAVTTQALLATSFDTTIDLNVGGTSYTASARSLLEAGGASSWLAGPLVSEWLVAGPVRTAGGVAHPHLSARFEIRAYGLDRVRVGVVIENTWSRVSAPQRYTYNATINVAGRGAAFTATNVTHYRQSRWRRLVWWGAEAALDVRHDATYFMATRAVPTYDPAVTVQGSAIDGMLSRFNAQSGVMDIGALEAYMPAAGGRPEIAPLPAFTAAYVMTQDLRAKDATVGHGVQAGAWPIHYRDEATGRPISLDTYPQMTILGQGFFPACGGNCAAPYEPDVSHQPSLAYVPYLVTGEHYLLEEVQFWANWILFYGEASRHGGAQGLVVWDTVRGQAWGLRNVVHAAWATPDGHPLKSYFEQKLDNNITYYRNNWVNSNPLGYLTLTGPMAWQGSERWISSWMDDFLTWTFGHIVALGYERARPVLDWKAKFPVGRLNDPAMCWVLASTYWPTARDDFYLGGSGAYVDTWDEWRRIVIFSWNNDAFRGTSSIAGREQALIDAACNSAEMASILGLARGEMIGYANMADGYSANLQPAAAVAVEAGIAGATQGFDKLVTAASYPRSAYALEPQWAVFPANAAPPRARPMPPLALTAN